METPLLEVIACSVADAVAAAEGGADRLELISHFEVGGLTPALDLATSVLAAVDIPVRVMLRENAGFAVASAEEMVRLCANAAALAALPVDGLVLGFLRDGEIDEAALATVLSFAPNLPATFHRAFEELPDPLAGLRVLKGFPQVDRILTSGGPAPWAEKVAGLAALAAAAWPEITILLGGGVTPEAIQLIRSQTQIREFHAGRAARVPETVDGVVSAGGVAALRRLLAGPLKVEVP